jgi:hypothetical protein
MEKQFHFEKPAKRLAFLILKDMKLQFMYGHHKRAVELIQLFIKHHFGVAVREQKLIIYYVIEKLFDLDKIDLIQSLLEKPHYEKICIINAIRKDRYEYLIRYVEKVIKDKQSIKNALLIIYAFEYLYEKMQDATKKQYEEGKGLIRHNHIDRRYRQGRGKHVLHDD